MVFSAAACRVLRWRAQALPLPAFEHGEVSTHGGNGLLAREAASALVLELVVELGALFDHLFHRAVPREVTVAVAVGAVFVVGRPVGFGAEVFGFRERHAAALAVADRFVFHLWRILHLW